MKVKNKKPVTVFFIMFIVFAIVVITAAYIFSPNPTDRFTLTVLGALFTLVPAILLFTMNKEAFGKKSSVVIGKALNVAIGLFFTITGAVFLNLPNVQTTFEPMLICILFVIVGPYITIASLFAPSKKIVMLKVERVEKRHGEFLITFGDENVPVGTLRSMYGKYYIYTTQSNAFKEGDVYAVNVYEYGMMLVGAQTYNEISAVTLESFKDTDFKKIRSYSDV